MVSKQMFIASVPTIILQFAVLRSIGNMARTVQARRMGVSKRRASVKSRGSKRVIRKGKYDTAGLNPSNVLTVKGYGFPDRLRTRLAYGQSFILTTSVGTPTPSVAYRMTSSYDPEVAIGGGQPYWFDQLAAVYNRYQVLGAKITAKFDRTTETAASVGPWLVGIQSSDSSSVNSANAGVLASTPNTSFELMGQDDGVITITQTYSPKTAFGENVASLTQARNNADPSLNWFATVFASVQGVTTSTIVNCVVTIEYFAEFFDQIQNAGS